MGSSAKRALVVDDSRSARVILSRMLEAHGVQVETTESAEQALDYLSSAQPEVLRPDVIFMDHLMPGMDGLQAVRTLKADPRTHSIPVMMYTSHEGEDYLQQAQACGASGVISKTLTQAEVARALYQLHLLPDRREISQREMSYPQTQSPQRAAPPLLAANDAVALPDTNINWSNKSPTSVDQPAPIAQAASLDAPRMPEKKATRSSAVWQTAVLITSLACALASALLWREAQQMRQLLVQTNAQLTATVAAQQQQIESLRLTLRQRAEASPPIEVWPVPYGEAPFASARVNRIRERIEALQAAGFKGVVRIENFVGDFCLTGSAVLGFVVARDDLLAQRCDTIGNPFEDGLTDAQRRTDEFDAMLVDVTGNSTNPLQLSIGFGSRKPTQAYPSQGVELKAVEWNRVAAQNNRVEMSLLPALKP
ncbi:MAG: response regulator [Candidatus Obscuribacterales bacterium]|nr:response regulator [Steroidobacteraceae bacterium]